MDSKKTVKSIIRIGILVIMVLLGLTAVAPEWLDLKDMIIAEHRGPVMEEELYQNQASSMSAYVKMINALDPSKLHERIVFVNPNDIATGTPILGLILFPLYVLYIAFMYVLFSVFSMSLFFAITSSIKRLYEPSLKWPKYFFYPVIVISTFVLSLSVWPYFGHGLVKMIIFIRSL